MFFHKIILNKHTLNQFLIFLDENFLTLFYNEISLICYKCNLSRIVIHLFKNIFELPGGALKPTDIDTLWVHVTCAWFRPEVSFASDEKMEPALGILSIPSNSFVKVSY